jgi:hypothetical protein
MGELSLTSSTVSDNLAGDEGGGIYYDAGMGFGWSRIKQSLLADNTAPTGTECRGNITSQGYNLIEDPTDCTIGGDLTGNVTGTDPLLGPLQDNGGETETHALQTGSPASDVIPPAACAVAVDQRGVSRPIVQCDIGAYESSGSLVALYTFEEGSGSVVRDVSGIGTPLDLAINNPSATRWFSGGLSVDAATIIASSGAATKIIDAARASNELTVEAWVRPTQLVQSTPSRIVTLSEDTSNRNFTLAHGQAGGTADDRYSFRLRTSVTDDNGMTGPLTTPDGSLTLNLTHVVYTRDASGNTNLYLDGVSEASGTVGGDFSNWNDTYRLALANEFGGNRSWLGEYDQMAVYNRALSAGEVNDNFIAGP